MKKENTKVTDTDLGLTNKYKGYELKLVPLTITECTDRRY